MSGVAGRSGRRRNVVKDNLHGKITFREPRCWEIIDKALAANDAEIARWLLEEKYGKPKQQVDISVAQAEGVARDSLAELNAAREETLALPAGEVDDPVARAFVAKVDAEMLALPVPSGGTWEPEPSGLQLLRQSTGDESDNVWLLPDRNNTT